MLGLLVFSKVQAQEPPANVAIQTADRFKVDSAKSISLSSVIEQALRANYDQNQRDFSEEVLNLNWEDTKEAFWMPQLSLSLQTNSQRIGRIKRGDVGGGGFSRHPTGSLSFGVQDYVVFNWGKDYLAYLNNKESYRRSTTSFKEQRRALRHEVIIKYFELAYFTRLVEIYRRQLRHTSFVYRFNREKVSIRKINRQEYYQARSEYLRAQNSFQEASNKQRLAEEEMAFLITDEPGTRYILKDRLDFQRIQMPLEEAEKIAISNNPEILESTKDVNNAKRSYQIQLRENLPLPKFSVNLGAYTHRFAPGVSTTRYESGLANNEIDLRASINASWSITGVGGFFNQRTTEKSLIGRQLSYSQLAEARHKTLSDLQRSYYRARTYEQQIRVLEAASETNNKTFDVILENYLDRKTAFINFSDALLESVYSDAALAERYYLHTREKVLLAQEMGVDELPGKSFENLGIPKESVK
ncbi:MAG: TolC family protein [Bacteriovoracaceae bacterium]|nr:TolC family protein [Bacteriovoracaceae bacterium]